MRIAMILSAVLMQGVATAQLTYPVSKKQEQVDEYFGTKVSDPYRWLEDDKSSETGDWVTAQNKVTFGYLNRIPARELFLNKIEQVFNYPKYSAPFRNGDWYYFYKNDGLQNQSVLYRQKGLKGLPEQVIDPNKLSADGTTRMTVFSLNKKGTYAVIGTSQGGSDWQTYQVRNMLTGEDMPDKLDWVKISGVSWTGEGFFYSRYPEPLKDASALSAKNENHQVWFHKIGTTQADDELVFEDAKNGQRFHTTQTDEDENYLFLYVSDRGKGLDGNALYFKNLKDAGAPFIPILDEITNDDYNVVEVANGRIYIQTNAGAPNKKLISVDIKNPDIKKAVTNIPEQKEPLQSVSFAGGRFFVSYLKDVSTKTWVYDLSGKRTGEVVYPAPGNGSGFGGRKDDKTLFYIFSSFTLPPTIFQYDIATGKSQVFRKPEVKFVPENYETKQVFYKSKDGTPIPMFIIHKKGLELDGNNVTLLYGYGGFNITLNPSFSALLIPFLDAGGVYAQANLRGGGEYGEEWHKAGMLYNKQNVFDDFIAAGEYLIENKYTSSARLALRGGSNGGLLVGTVINQRPDLARVAIPQVGVMDMLRFHKFTIGWNWIADYGSSESDEKSFKNLYAYSPMHNITETKYPSTLVTTADHDDRVVPAHSFKYIATLQEKNKGENPVLIRIDTKSGHGASNTRKNMELTADIYAFIFNECGVEPKF